MACLLATHPATTGSLPLALAPSHGLVYSSLNGSGTLRTDGFGGFIEGIPCRTLLVAHRHDGVATGLGRRRACGWTMAPRAPSSWHGLRNGKVKRARALAKRDSLFR